MEGSKVVGCRNNRARTCTVCFVPVEPAASTVDLPWLCSLACFSPFCLSKIRWCRWNLLNELENVVLRNQWYMEGWGNARRRRCDDCFDFDWMDEITRMNFVCTLSFVNNSDSAKKVRTFQQQRKWTLIMYVQRRSARAAVSCWGYLMFCCALGTISTKTLSQESKSWPVRSVRCYFYPTQFFVKYDVYEVLSGIIDFLRLVEWDRCRTNSL